MKRTVCYFCVCLEVIMMLALFGCGRQKYALNFDGYGFESKKTAYAAGDRVTVYFKLIATDTDYRFWADDDVALSQDYDNEHGYIFNFTMPKHDVTLHVESHNSMLAAERESLRVTLVNNVATADFWIMPQTEDNLKSSLWGTATAKALGAGEQRDITLTEPAEQLFIVRAIDEDHAYFSVKDVTLGDGYTIRFQTNDSRFDAVIEVLDADGTVLKTQPAFVGAFGAK